MGLHVAHEFCVMHIDLALRRISFRQQCRTVALSSSICLVALPYLHNRRVKLLVTVTLFCGLFCQGETGRNCFFHPLSLFGIIFLYHYPNILEILLFRIFGYLSNSVLPMLASHLEAHLPQSRFILSIFRLQCIFRFCVFYVYFSFKPKPVFLPMV